MSRSGMGAAGMGYKRQPKETEHHYRKCKNIVKGHAATPSLSSKHHVQKDPCKKVVPTSPGIHIKRKSMLPKNNHCAEVMAERINIKDEDGTNIGHYYKCKQCGFDCGTKAACVAHTHREHTDERIGPCKYCGTFYAHSADTMKYHVNDCAGSTTGSDDDDN